MDRRADERGQRAAEIFVAGVVGDGEAQGAAVPFGREPSFGKADGLRRFSGKSGRNAPEARAEVFEAVLKDEPAPVHEGDMRGAGLELGKLVRGDEDRG